MDAAGFLFMALLSVYLASPTSPHMPYSWPNAVYTSCQHLLPLMIMAGCMPWCAQAPGISSLQLRTLMPVQILHCLIAGPQYTVSRQSVCSASTGRSIICLPLSQAVPCKDAGWCLHMPWAGDMRQ